MGSMIVGANGFWFVIIAFQFYPLNHSVVKMDPQYPCKPWEKIHKDSSALWSGFHAMDAFLDPVCSMCGNRGE